MSATPFQLDSACLPIYRPAAFEHTIIDGIQDLIGACTRRSCVARIPNVSCVDNTHAWTSSRKTHHHIHALRRSACLFGRSRCKYAWRKAMKVSPPPPESRRYICSLCVNTQSLCRRIRCSVLSAMICEFWKANWAVSA
jgi:hypothetical protein